MDFLLHESPAPFVPLWLNIDAGLFAVLDREDYDWARQWTWHAKPDRHGRKWYAVRAMGINKGGRRIRTVSIFLHKEICLRTHGMPPGPLSTVGDHKDGQSLNCRRENLRWATRSENRQNIGGWYARQLQMGLTNTL